MASHKTSDRQILKAINSHYDGSPYYLIKKEVIEGRQTWLYVNEANRHLGIVDMGNVLWLHDTNNEADTPNNPTLKLSKGKKIKPI